ncbi:Armadillo-like helical-containing protein [Dioscorea alata]|uniref:Armadillo-like helical-containing protein n=1 Tax=Dioscorea alata TaxID=55571 RepID=A0ACB7WIY1_DIOAL|nr:Armadillo-like helical-containing protein [Dioscorea alata]
MECGDFLVGNKRTNLSPLPIHMKRTLFRKQRTNFEVMEVQDPYKKLEVLLCMTETKLNSFKQSMEKDKCKKIKIEEERRRRRQQQQQQQNELERRRQQQQNELERRHQQQQNEDERRPEQQVNGGNHNNNNNDNDQEVWKWEGPPPEWIVKTIENFGGESLKYLFRKKLTISDVVGQQNRLLPTRKDMRQVVIPYLTEEERSKLEQVNELKVMVIDVSGTEYKTMIMKWYSSLKAHRIIGPDWSNFVRNNKLEPSHHVVYVWGFRVTGKLWLAFDYALTGR